jgi:hypothetical protein
VDRGIDYGARAAGFEESRTNPPGLEIQAPYLNRASRLRLYTGILLDPDPGSEPALDARVSAKWEEIN